MPVKIQEPQNLGTANIYTLLNVLISSVGLLIIVVLAMGFYMWKLHNRVSKEGAAENKPLLPPNESVTNDSKIRRRVRKTN